MIKVLSKFVPKEPFTFLVSGGVDSIAAAHWLKYSYKKEFNILHFNHNCQDCNSTMENNVKWFAETFDIKLDIIRSGGILPCNENALREWRLKCMDIYSTDITKYVTAHHLNDAVENYLDNCMKGCPEYKPIREISDDFAHFDIYHPFLTSKKSSFIEYCNKNKLNKFIVEDPTNTNNKHKRNWIRNVLVKEINERNLGLEKVVLKKFYSNE